jgi:DNA-binding MltR family transcriptional regulator
MSQSENTVFTLTQEQLVTLLAKQTQAGNALVIASLVEDHLEQLLVSAMRPLSNKKSKRIFESYGPLGSFSAKIDIAYAFSLIEPEVYADLRAIKDIRNAFAHAKNFQHFGSEEIVRLARKLSNWKEGDSEIFYRTRALECINAVRSTMEQRIYAAALQHPLPDDDED